MSVQTKRITYLFFYLTVLAMLVSLLFLFIKHHQVHKPDIQQLTIVANHYNEDVNWLKQSTIPVVICSKTLPSPQCHVGKNKGRETTAILKYIIDNYENLPKHIAFLHGHETAWHHRGKKGILQVLQNCAKINDYGYISLNNHFIDDRNMDNPKMKHLHELWPHLFEPFLKRPAPTYLLHDCCAQFIVTRDRIRRLPKRAYEKWYNYIMHEDPNNDDGYIISVVFEYIWHIIFGEPDIVTRDEYKQQFACDFA